tara:strand:- start:402 stop:761 length:360 start_codon:yes stop_codon:yes gene_type:complete
MTVEDDTVLLYNKTVQSPYRNFLPAVATRSATTTTTAASTRRARTSFIDRQLTSTEVFPVEFFDCPLSPFTFGHFHEAKATGTTGLTIRDQVDTFDLSILFEKLTKFVISGTEREISNI